MFQRLKTAFLGPRLRPGSYAQHFRRALEISGHPSGQDHPLNVQVPDFDTRVEAFQRQLQTEAIPFFAFAPTQCLNSALYLAPVFSEATGIRAWPTLGQLWYNGKPVFYLSEGNARRLVRSKAALDAFALASDGFTFHVWITLETGAILDATILASITARDPELQRPGATVLGNPETALPGHCYVPLLVGQDVIETILHNSSIPGVILFPRGASQ